VPVAFDISDMGWLRLVGSLKLQVSFAKEPYRRDLYSAKETYNLKEPTNRGIRYKRYRVAKTHRMTYLYRSFSAKEPYT